MTELNRKTVSANKYPVRIIQFGEGNFLRAFANWMIHKMNKEAGFDAGVAVVQPIDRGLVGMLNEQDCLYTLYLNGIRNGEVVSEHEVIDCIQRAIDPYVDYEEYLKLGDNPDIRFILSNTTEAGIAHQESDFIHDTPPSSFPAKLTSLLHRRFKTFGGDPAKGLIIIPCELIDRNGDNLKSIVLQYAKQWDLEPEFLSWIDNDNVFCNTLVDRIVPGYPKAKMDAITKELGYNDKLVVEGEQFHLWVIEGPKSIKEEFPSEKAGLNVIFTDDMEPYRTRKVRILNGAHTTMVPVSYLSGIETVRETVEDDVLGKYVSSALQEEIIPTLDLPIEELKSFASDVMDRFKNPYLHHELITISLNSIAKFKTRVLPSLLEYVNRKQSLPAKLTFSLASLIKFYGGDNNGTAIPVKDDAQVLDFFTKEWKAVNDGSQKLANLVENVLSNSDFWGQDLTAIAGLQERISQCLEAFEEKGVLEALKGEL